MDYEYYGTQVLRMCRHRRFFDAYLLGYFCFRLVQCTRIGMDKLFLGRRTYNVPFLELELAGRD